MSTYLFRDSTSATEHTISILGDINTCASIAKLKVTTTDNQPLYWEESVV
jgi:hypothetical protein